MTQPLVLITGGSGFIAGHCILRAVEAGWAVRTTVRSLAKEAEVRATLTAAGLPAGAPLAFVAADLTDDAGWAEACAGVDAVMHVASPVMPGHVRDEESVIAPAREGTLRVLRAAHATGVRRAVLTSAFHAIGFGHPRGVTAFTDDMWSPLDGPGMDAYGRSKVLAERAAWDFVAGDGAGMELTALCPVAVMGPIMGHAISGSNHLLLEMLTGKLPVMANIALPIVDVRDVAAAHVAALSADEAKGSRILLSDGNPAMPLASIAELLRSTFPAEASRVPTRRLPDALVRVLGRVVPAMRGIVPDLGRIKRPSIDRARAVLGFSPRPGRDAIVDAAASMIQAGLVPARR